MDLPAPPFLIANLCVAIAAVIAFLYTIAAHLRARTDVLRLRVQTHELREEYHRRLEELRRGADAIEVDIVGEIDHAEASAMVEQQAQNAQTPAPAVAA